MTLALRDVDRFKRQKAKDLKDAFTNYAIMQIHRCRKVYPARGAAGNDGFLSVALLRIMMS